MDYCPVRSPDRDCSLSILRIRAKSATPITLCFTRFAFTLAEVLITLAIIGVVAAMTIPTLIQNHKEKVTVTKLKKFYSVMSQAYQMAEQEYGDPTNWDLIANDSIEGSQNMAEKFKPFLKIIKEENCGVIGRCAYTLADGTLLQFAVRSKDCSSVRGINGFAKSCGLIEVDFSGKISTANAGKTFFQFVLTQDRIVPSGSHDDRNYSFSNNCAKTAGGYGCGAWILLNENMDYLHCNDLDWGGKTTCK